MIGRRILMAGACATAYIAGTPAAVLAADPSGGAESGAWLTGTYVLAAFLWGVIVGALFMPVWRTLHPQRRTLETENAELIRALHKLTEKVQGMDMAVRDINGMVKDLGGQVSVLRADVRQQGEMRSREQSANRVREPRAAAPDGMTSTGTTSDCTAFGTPSPALLADHWPISLGSLDVLADLMDEYRRVMEDENRVEAFLEQRRALRAVWRGADWLDLVDSPTADLWVLPPHSAGKALILPSRRMLTRNFSALAANRGEGVRRQLGPMFDIDFTDVETPLVVRAARADLDGQRARLVEPGLLRFPRQ
ncbi:hypothetical protein [Azospirillum lipoferum]|uniref:Uncharacterized protein n=1 Tax=Azospirillum lipoferum (strain 4B) TaxID=862719 RepID=G7Z3V7_AZOL4|nr:hypothetical protein [Azospirillum lipoferum]CBS86076.1 Protein of unknown function [Azospirillum lipoferum 4B]